MANSFLLLETGDFLLQEDGVSKIILETTVGSPVITVLSPADGATGVEASTSLVATFSQSIQAGFGYVLLRQSSTGVESFNIATGLGDDGGTISVSGTQLTIVPGSALSGDYNVFIPVYAIDNLDGNTFTGILDETTWSFSTEAEPSPTPPPPGGVGGSAFRRVTRAEYKSTFEALKRRLSQEEWQESVRQLDLLQEYVERAAKAVPPNIGTGISILADLVTAPRTESINIQQQIERIAALVRELDDDDAMAAILTLTLVRR